MKFKEIQPPKHDDYIPKRNELKRRILSYHPDTGKIYDRGIEVGCADFANENELVNVKFIDQGENEYVINTFKIIP